MSEEIQGDGGGKVWRTEEGEGRRRYISGIMESL